MLKHVAFSGGDTINPQESSYSLGKRTLVAGLIGITSLGGVFGSDSPSLPSEVAVVEIIQPSGEKGGGLGAVDVEAVQAAGFDYMPDFHIYDEPFPLVGGWSQGEQAVERQLDEEERIQATGNLVRALNAFNDAVKDENVSLQADLLGVIDFYEAERISRYRGNYSRFEQYQLNAQQSINEETTGYRELYGNHFLSAMETTSGLRVNFSLRIKRQTVSR